jgi:hypothetical protein
VPPEMITEILDYRDSRHRNELRGHDGHVPGATHTLNSYLWHSAMDIRISLTADRPPALGTGSTAGSRRILWLVRWSDDAIFSLGNVLNHYGWAPGQPVAIPVSLPAEKARELIQQTAILVNLPTPEQPTEAWIEYLDFYVLMEYNQLFLYAMSVYQLAKAIAKG